MKRFLVILMTMVLLGMGGVSESAAEGSVFQASVPAETPVFAVETLPEAYQKAMNGLSWKPSCPVPLSELRRVRVGFWNLDGVSSQGELVVHRKVAQEVLEIFQDLYAARYPLRRMALVDVYGADDRTSMEWDNTSAFNYRTVAGTAKLSKHSYGLAIDINPVENPYVKGTEIQPSAGSAFTDRGWYCPGMILAGDACHKAFTSRGWTWGGDWKTMKDWQHFEKAVTLP